MDLYTFYRRFGEELSNVEKNNQAYTKFCKSRGQGEEGSLSACSVGPVVEFETDC